MALLLVVCVLSLGTIGFQLESSMRKIEQEMRQAIISRSNWSGGNTRVSIDGDTANVFLHGNHIASCRYDFGKFVVVANEETLAQWPTNTTRSRLRALGVPVTVNRGNTTVTGYGHIITL